MKSRNQIQRFLKLTITEVNSYIVLESGMVIYNGIIFKTKSKFINFFKKEEKTLDFIQNLKEIKI